MGKKGGSTGVNTKVAAANAKKAEAKAAKDAKAAAIAEAEESVSWEKGGNARAAKRNTDSEQKRLEMEAKRAEVARLKAMEEHQNTKIEDKSAQRQFKTKAKKELNKPWEEALAGVTTKKNNRGSRASTTNTEGKITLAMREAMKEKEEKAKQQATGRSGIQFQTSEITMNRNRTEDAQNEARSVDAAIDLLTIGEPDLQKHPEKRAKAAYKAFEANMLPQLKEDFPGLKLSQYKQKLSDLWRKSPENPLNQASLAYNAKK